VPKAEALAALERMDLTPEQKDFLVLQAAVQAPVPAHAKLTNPIDRFLETARKEKGLKGCAEGGQARAGPPAYLDLLGPAAYACAGGRVRQRHVAGRLAAPEIDKLLGVAALRRALRPPLARRRRGNADTDGYEFRLRPGKRLRYRDYVIKAFNEDKPYNVFVKEQLAGDELDQVTDDSLVATGFMPRGGRACTSVRKTTPSAATTTWTTWCPRSAGACWCDGGLREVPQPQVSSPISSKDYYSLITDVYGYVELDVPLAPKPQADAYTKANADIDAKAAGAARSGETDRRAGSHQAAD